MTPRVVVVGAGLAGLAATRRLRQVGLRVSLVDDAERVGGRVGSTTFDVPGRGVATFDHGPQCWLPYERPAYPSAERTERLLSVLTQTGRQNLLRSWEVLRAVPAGPDAGPGWQVEQGGACAVAGGMRELALALAPGYADEVDIRLRTRVVSVSPTGGRWKVRTDDGESVAADAVVLTPPVPVALGLLDPKDVPLPPGAWAELRAVEYTRCLAVLVVTGGPTRLPPGGLRLGEGPVEFVSDNHPKGLSAVGPAVTALTGHEFAAANWEVSDDEVVDRVMEALRPWADGPVLTARVRRWAYCQPTRTFPGPYAVLRDPPLALAGDGFDAGGFGAGMNRAFASGWGAADGLIRVLSGARRSPAADAPPRRITLEVSVSSADDALAAVGAGADRLEVCAHLDCGGLTPSLGTFQAVREAVAVPVYALLRPRSGGFRYSAEEFRAMRRDAELFLQHGADGVVFGVLTGSGEVDVRRAGELVGMAAGRAVFHRAFDFTPDLRAALDALVELRFERVQTSGRKRTAAEGAARIAGLVRAAAWNIEVLPAGGIRPENVARLLRDTGCDQVHASLRTPVPEGSLRRNPGLADQMAADGTGGYRVTDAGLVAAMREELDRFARRAADEPTAEG